MFTCITTIRDSIHITQHPATGPETALRTHVGTLPYEDGAGPHDDEADWALTIVDGTGPVALQPVLNCLGVWFWLNGSQREPPYTTYIIRTVHPTGP